MRTSLASPLASQVNSLLNDAALRKEIGALLL
jgi:hypothetical protein